MTVLILTPLELEYLAVREHVLSLEKVYKTGKVYERGIFKGQHDEYNIVLCQTDATNKTMALETQIAIGHFNPNIAILVGIAGGVKDVSLGSVVVGKKIYDYESGKITEEGFVARPDVLNCSTDLVKMMESIGKDDIWHHRIKTTPEQPRLFFGAIATGEKVIASTDSELYMRIKKYYNDTLAVEMEGYGFAKALQNHPQIRYAIIRGISDLIDEKTESDEKGSQPKAVAHAAAFLFELLDQLDVSKHLNLITMDHKEIATAVFKQLLPIIENGGEIPSSLTTTGGLAQLKELIKETAPIVYQDLIDDPTDDDLPGAFRTSLKKLVLENDNLKSQFENLLQQINANGPQSQTVNNISVKDSKNVITGGNFDVKGDFNLGDKTNNNSGNTYIADTINFGQDRPSRKPKDKLDDNSTPLTEQEELKQLLGEGKIDEVLEKLMVITANNKDQNNTIIHIKGRWSQVSREKNNNLVTDDYAQMQSSRIISSILGAIDDLYS